MKTLIIYNEIPTKSPQFLILEGDFSRFNGVEFNMNIDHPHEEECNEFMFNPETGEIKHEFSGEVSVIESKDFDKVALITFYC